MKRPLLVAALCLCACNSNIDPQFRVRDVRILAVRSRAVTTPPDTPQAPADVSPGDTIVLEALVANPLGRPGLAIDWFVCPPTASEAVSPCADLGVLQEPGRLFTLSSGPNPSVLHLGTGASVQYPVPTLGAALGFVIETARRTPAFACRMYAEVVVVVLARAEGRQSLAVKTVRVKPPAADIAAAGLPDYYVLNHNPQVADVLRHPADPDGCTGGPSLRGGIFPAGRTVLCGVAAGNAEQYNVCDPDVRSTTESFRWQWYVTDGDFPDVGGVGNATGDHLDFTRPAGAFTLWAIVRDGRGGDDWITLAVSAL